MSLQRVKALYCIAVISIGILLASTGGFVGWAASIIVLCGALPMFRVIRCAAEQRGVNDYRRLRQSAARRILSSAQAKADALEAGK
jgi:hypothetical protein